MRRILSILLFTVLYGMAAGAVETSDAFLGRIAAKIESVPSMEVTYALTTDGVSQRGTLILSGNRFKVVSPGMESWFDGKTQWTYSSRIGEVNVTEPTVDEIGQINPFSVIGAFRRDYKSEFIPSGAGVKKILMTSRVPDSDITSVQLTVDEKTLKPSEIILTLSSRQVIIIRVESVKEGKALPASLFRFNRADYPDIEVVDLR